MVSGNGHDVRRGEQGAAGIGIAVSIHDITRATDEIDAFTNQMRERSVQPAMLGMNVADQSNTSNGSDAHESIRSIDREESTRVA